MDVITDSMDMSLSKLWEIAEDREAWRATVHGATKTRHNSLRGNTLFFSAVGHEQGSAES